MRRRRRSHDLRIARKVHAAGRVVERRVRCGLHHQNGNVRSRPAQHVGESREQRGALVQRRIDEGEERARRLARRNFGPGERRRQGGALEADGVAVEPRQEFARRQDVIGVPEIAAVGVAMVVQAEDGRGALAAGTLHRLLDLGRGAIGDHEGWAEGLEDPVELQHELFVFEPVRLPRIVVLGDDRLDGYAAQREGDHLQALAATPAPGRGERTSRRAAAAPPARRVPPDAPRRSRAAERRSGRSRARALHGRPAPATP